MWVIVTNKRDGRVIGPFASEAAAKDHARSDKSLVGCCWRAVQLTAPENRK